MGAGISSVAAVKAKKKTSKIRVPLMIIPVQSQDLEEQRNRNKRYCLPV